VLNAGDIEEFNINTVINTDRVRGRGESADRGTRRREVWVAHCMRKGQIGGFAERTVPVETVEVLTLLVTQGVIVKQGGGQLFEDLVDNLPVGWAEVSTEGLVAREEQLVRNYVRECT